MKKTGMCVAAALLLLCSCGQQNEKSSTETPAVARLDTGYTKPIDIDTANRMIQSYLDGINYRVNTQEIKALIVDADAIRSYLDSNVNGNANRIDKIKFVFAHSLDYVNSGHQGQRPDTNSHALTFVIVGYDVNGNYVYTKGGMALDFAQPCPPRCPVQGNAGSNLLVHYNK